MLVEEIINNVYNISLDKFGINNYDAVLRIVLNYMLFHNNIEYKTIVYGSLCSDYSKVIVDRVIDVYLNETCIK